MRQNVAFLFGDCRHSLLQISSSIRLCLRKWWKFQFVDSKQDYCTRNSAILLATFHAWSHRASGSECRSVFVSSTHAEVTHRRKAETRATTPRAADWNFLAVKKRRSDVV